MQQVLDNLRDLPPTTGAKDIDLLFLRGIIESPIVRSLAKAHERLADVKLEAVRDNNQQLVSEILDSLTGLSSRDASAEELANILQEPHFKSLIEAHDKVAAKCYEMLPSEVNSNAMATGQLVPADAVRMIGIQKKAGEPLGVTFRVARGELVIARILHGSMIDRQGMLHAGDVIREVNGREVGSDPKELLELLRDCQGGITLKILPSYRDTPAPPQVHLKTHFNYSPATDNLIPCKEAGLAFSKGDVLHIVNREDPNWWQAVNIVGGATGLIPSQFLEEKRKAFVRREWNGSGVLCGTLTGKKKKKKMMYLMSKNAVTSRPAREEERDGQSYCFVSRSQMEADIKASRYLEHGEYDGNLYGTKMNSIHEVVAAGRTCILDVNPQALKQLKTAEFMPFVVFVAAPELDTLRAMHKAVVDAGLTTKLLTETDLKKTVDESARIRRAYSHYFDLTIVNDNLDKAFEQLQAAVEQLCSEPQWVPVSWVY
ncbi:MAGUK p55 subfamily member 6 isoform X2 [Salmo trutta]|uniref:MAGUK p55 subfamily member 6 isoform X2 n=1 Tax=Salmo trutta TaxID=8032 RepID=UPI001130284E|nr:MAGUK p55 subfamily member 6-like isoform X2 [Salmo trutta]